MNVQLNVNRTKSHHSIQIMNELVFRKMMCACVCVFIKILGISESLDCQNVYTSRILVSEETILSWKYQYIRKDIVCIEHKVRPKFTDFIVS